MRCFTHHYRIAQLINPNLSLGERQEKLLIRLDIGLPAKGAELGKYLRNKLTRYEYHNLIKAKLIDFDTLGKCSDEEIIAHMNGDSNVEKLKIIREAIKKYQLLQKTESQTNQMLELYEA